MSRLAKLMKAFLVLVLLAPLFACDDAGLPKSFNHQNANKAYVPPRIPRNEDVGMLANGKDPDRYIGHSRAVLSFVNRIYLTSLAGEAADAFTFDNDLSCGWTPSGKPQNAPLSWLDAPNSKIGISIPSNAWPYPCPSTRILSSLEQIRDQIIILELRNDHVSRNICTLLHNFFEDPTFAKKHILGKDQTQGLVRRGYEIRKRTEKGQHLPDTLRWAGSTGGKWIDEWIEYFGDGKLDNRCYIRTGLFGSARWLNLILDTGCSTDIRGGTVALTLRRDRSRHQLKCKKPR